MPKIINIHGPMAAGKSTIVDVLHKKLKSYALVDRAYMKWMLKPAATKADARKISKKATFLIFRELMKLKKNIIVQEVNPLDFRKKLRNYMQGYKLYSFYIYCSLDTALKRDVARSKKTRPHLVRKINSRFDGPIKGDVPINTEECSVEKAVKIILREVRKR